MHTHTQKPNPPDWFVPCDGCGRQLRVTAERLLTGEPVLCGWCVQDLLRAEQMRGESGDSRGSARTDGPQRGKP
jgi:hypothetical protein